MTANHSHKALATELNKRAGQTYADEAEITLQNTPVPLFELLVLSMLLGARISANIAVSAARELFSAGLRNPKAVIDADRKTVVDALGRGNYARYDESTATQLTETSQILVDEYDGDLRKLAHAAENDAKAAHELLQEFKGVGPVGADIFLREVQGVWTWAAPYFDKKSVQSAKDLGLPTDPAALADLAPSGEAAFAAALIRASLDKDLRELLDS